MKSQDEFKAYIRSRFPDEYEEITEQWPEARIYEMFQDEWSIWTYQGDKINAIESQIQQHRDLSKASMMEVYKHEDEIKGLREITKIIQSEKSNLFMQNIALKGGIHCYRSALEQEQKRTAELQSKNRDLELQVMELRKELEQKRTEAFDLAHQLKETEQSAVYDLRA